MDPRLTGEDDIPEAERFVITITNGGFPRPFVYAL